MMVKKTPEENARAIIQILVDRGVQPLEIDNYSSVETAFTGSKTEFREGLEYAVQQEWVVIIDQHQVRLTEAGYNAARP
jgi:hypothetical protein